MARKPRLYLYDEDAAWRRLALLAVDYITARVDQRIAALTEHLEDDPDDIADSGRIFLFDHYYSQDSALRCDRCLRPNTDGFLRCVHCSYWLCHDCYWPHKARRRDERSRGVLAFCDHVAELACIHATFRSDTGLFQFDTVQPDADDWAYARRMSLAWLRPQ